ncbi:Gfo/Idh/MocA family protein [Corynebacterium ammoniagenes]|uniref:Inositol 2-dehydrogenase n=2 Tax=Corynebacterium ammoniagenes TaxID=1697 RepID=A0AAV5G5A6_CORAM|nr:Gfo/Idh/MocA family oxidoreductase [Corynebacterium ammoniagenes]APT82028.1 inositol 2-dehydrogenase [Corynebacterium ammoniagenes DSM 20306]AQS73140.1 inositol 2-dehydrogenase [Corynebacterium ammoniagenes]EFG80432.1 oxidoreductase, NAD-binding domain protein [Corynebacterium ammoniagenes DSM 20306]NMF31807.1 Gfo/Idh/MocA family oxidoreductase [Corynebacterium ammoniagenes]GJN41839.1 inositol 2-dehydrogenase [Corynebacterium ammoniagenes]
MTKSLRVGVVGAGAMGADHIDRINNRTSGAFVSAIVEPDAGRTAKAAENAPGAQTFAKIEDAIAADAVDAVLIAVPGQFHEPVLIPALEAGLPILCEKPLTPDSESSLRIVELEQKLDKPHIQVGFMRRFDPEYNELRKLVAAKDAGELLMLHAVHRNPTVGENYHQSMLITDSVVHEFDVIPWLAESRVVNVEVRYPKTSSLSHSGLKEPIIVLMELENGVLVDVEMNVNVQFGYQVTTEAVFEQGLARIGQPAGIQRWSAGQFSVKDHEDFTTRFATAYDRQIQSWVNAVHDGTLVAGPNAWDGYLVALSCEAGVKALEEGGIIPVEAEPRPDFYA